MEYDKDLGVRVTLYDHMGVCSMGVELFDSGSNTWFLPARHYFETALSASVITTGAREIVEVDLAQLICNKYRKGCVLTAAVEDAVSKYDLLI